MSLFPTAQRNNYLVEFNAGKCIREGSTLKPDTRKGVIYLDQDFIIFPEEADFVHVKECTTGRVYVLKFKSSSQKQFYWMQNKSEDKDKELVRKVNQTINDPSSASDQGSFDNAAQSDFMQMLSGGAQGEIEMSQENLLHFIENAGLRGSLSSLPRQQHISSTAWNQLKEKLDEISVEEHVSLDLGDALNTEAANAILGDADIRSSLFPFIPSSDSKRTKEQIEQLVQEQQFQKRLQAINKAIEQDRMNTILDDLNSEKNLKSFLKAVEEQAKEKNGDAMEEDL
ncbi:proteasome complex subunit Rpn13 ubiquitin receptor-domain-containing protein [Sporodiniella umbellata]|nr:proteasome complex subunit Rpn13 ubiquitin receptor-domain-containing protein [Sporodiniella umbellata]